MTVSKWSWGKSHRPENGDVICTRLILPAVFPAAIKTRNSEGFCEDNLLLQMSEQNSQGGARPTMLTIPIHISPVQADNSYLLTKINNDCFSNTPLAGIKAVIIPAQKEDAAHNRRHPLINLLGSILIHFEQDSKEVFLLFGGLGGKKFITLQGNSSTMICWTFL